MISIKSEDSRPKKGSWAPGSYLCKCLACECSFTGDKRALICADCAYEGNPSPQPNLRGEECQYALDQGTPEHRCAVRCVYEEKGFAAGIEQAARVAERYDETDTLSAPKAIASAIRALTTEGQP